MVRIANALRLFGIDPTKAVASASGLPKFLRDYSVYRKQVQVSGDDFPVTRFYPVLSDHLSSSGVANGHYFHQDIHVARRVLQNNPRRHLDIASRVDGFVAHVAVFREIEVADIRPLETTAQNIRFVQSDIMNPQSIRRLGSADSVSCLHSIEHFGLGRYGDPIRVDGHVVGLKMIASLVEASGRLYISVPIGPQRTEFNGQRVFAAQTIPRLLADEFVLESFAYVDDAGDMNHEPEWKEPELSRNFNCHYGCGIYELRRK